MATGMKRELRATYAEALEKVIAALKVEGFGVLTEVDVQQTLKNKINVDFRRYKILGACNPPLAHEALTVDLDAGLMMPCNVVVHETDRGTAMVTAMASKVSHTSCLSPSACAPSSRACSTA